MLLLLLVVVFVVAANCTREFCRRSGEERAAAFLVAGGRWLAVAGTQ